MPLSFMRITHCVLLGAAVLHARAANTLGPPVTVAMPAGYSNEVQGSAYDAYNDTLYFSTGQNTALFVPGASKLGATWPFAHLAGSPTFGSGAASTTEVAPLLATFANPRGVVGWPVYAALGLTAPVHHAEYRWTGVLLSDCFNNAIRFINFGRGNNVTTVAGGTPGANDGVGTGAQLRRPFMITWGVLTVPYPAANGGGVGLYPTVAWCDEYNNCVRSGVPVYNSNPFALMNTTAALQSMALKTATFFGLCAAAGTTGIGSAYNVAVLNGPNAVILANPFRLSGNPALATLMFVTEWPANRLSLVTPLWPPGQRFLTALWTTSGPVVGVRAYVRPYVPVGGAWEADVELVLALGGLTTYENVTTTLQNISGGIQWKGAGALVATTLVTTGLGASRESIIIPQVYVQGGAEMSRSVLVVHGGASGATLIQQACCLDAWYAGGIPRTSSASTSGTSSPRSSSRTTASGSLSTPATDSPTWNASSTSSASETLGPRSASETASATDTRKTASTSMSVSYSAETDSVSASSATSSGEATGVTHPTRSRSRRRHTETSTPTITTTPNGTTSGTGASTMTQVPSLPSRTRMREGSRTEAGSKSFTVFPPAPSAIRALDTAADVAGGTRTLLTGGATVATHSLLSMQRLSGVLTATRCKSDKADSRPVWYTNPFEWCVAAKSVRGISRVGPTLSGYWRAEWLILASISPLVLGVAALVLLFM